MLKALFRKKEERAACCAVVAAAGASVRMGGDGSKQFLDLLGRPLLSYVLEALQNARQIDAVVLVVREEDLLCTADLVAQYEFNKVKTVVQGGAQRSASVLIGLQEVSPRRYPYTAVLDGARPLVVAADIDRAVAAARQYGAAVLGSPVYDTIKLCDETGRVLRTVDRNTLFAAATPQVFRTEVLLGSLSEAARLEISITDESMALERLGLAVHCVFASGDLRKVTVPEDLAAAEAILQKRR